MTFQDAIERADDQRAAAALLKGAFSDKPRRLQHIADLAFQNNHAATAVALISRGIAPRSLEGTATVASAAALCPGSIPALLARGYPVDAVDSAGRTGLIVCASSNRLDSIDVLIRAGAAPNAINFDGETALTLTRDAAVADRLVAGGADVNRPNAHGATPMALRSRNGDTAVVRVLLRHGASTDEPSMPRSPTDTRQPPIPSYSLSPAQVAAREAASVRAGPLVEAANGGHVDTLRVILGARPASGARQRALYAAVTAGSSPCVKALMGAGARPDLSAAEWHTAVVQARRLAFVDVLQLLAEFGVHESPSLEERERRNYRKQTPLLTAIRRENRTAAGMLLDLGADVNVRDYLDRTPLLEAADHCPDLVPRLLAMGANPNAISRYGDSALKSAVLSSRLDIVQQLLQHGANPNLSRPADHTPLYYARKHGRAEITARLVQASAREQ